MNGAAINEFSVDEDQLLAQIQKDPQDAVHRVVSVHETLTKRLAQRDNEIALFAKLEEEKRLDRARRFGASFEAGDHQYRLFDEAEGHQDESAPEEVEPSELIEVAAHSKRKPKRKPLPANLPRMRVNHDLDDADKFCACGAHMTVIGEKVLEQLDVIPAQVYVIEHHRPTYSCARS